MKPKDIDGSKKIAIIGIGHVAEFQLHALSMCSNWRLVAAADLRKERATLLPAGVSFFTSAEELIDKVETDIILVSVPNQFHFELGKLVLQHGCNLLLEKPCCQNKDELHTLNVLASSSNAMMFVALHAMFAQDLQWLLNNINQYDLCLEDLTSFWCGFYDPYVVDSKLSNSAQSLGGSWFDSGINALSVIASLIPPDQLSVAHSRFTNIELVGCNNIQASVDIKFSNSQFTGEGIIETNWALGLNRKMTRLFFARNNREVLLDHSNETLFFSRAGNIENRVVMQNTNHRLVNHYLGVFRNAFKLLMDGESNLSFSNAIHELLFDAEEKAAKDVYQKQKV